MKTKLLLLPLAGLIASAAHAQVTFVDAEANVNTSPTIAAAGWDGAAASSVANNGQWAIRAPYGTGGHSIQGLTSVNPNSLPELTTSVSLADGTYDFYVFFYANGAETWTVEAGFTSGSLTNYSANTGDANVVLASTLSFVSDPSFDAGGLAGYNLYAANIGTQTVSGGAIDIYIDHADAATGFDSRTWYDGVGYSAVPEPGTFALLAGVLALSAVAVRRRK
ncbi:PEP-CTERM sorting domain-containing protein [Coraliomargarita akajimensis]|nr:PEP-CTERM sorting domain-containing protein [Coraliomargarita akajimensis]